MQRHIGIILGLSIILTSCGGGGSGSGSSSASSDPAPQAPTNTSPSFEDAALSVNFPLNGSLSTTEAVAFSGRVADVPTYDGVEVRVLTPSDTYVSTISSERWTIENVLLSESSAQTYRVELRVAGELVDSQTVQVGFDAGFLPFGIGDALALDEQAGVAYLIDKLMIYEIDLTSGERSLIADISARVDRGIVDMLWLTDQKTLLLLDVDGNIHEFGKGGSGWFWGDGIQGLSVASMALGENGQEVFVYLPNNLPNSNLLGRYNDVLDPVAEYSLGEDIPAYSQLAFLDGNALVFSEDSLLVFDLAAQSSQALSLESLDLGTIGDLAVDEGAGQIYLRNASNNELWRLTLDLGASPTLINELVSFAEGVSYAMDFSQTQNRLVFSSKNRLSALESGSGLVQVISRLSWGSGEDWVAPASLALGTEGQQAFVSDLATDDIYVVGLESGNRTRLNANGESMEAVAEMVQDGQNIYSVDWAKKSVLMTDVSSGLTSNLVLAGTSQPEFSEPIAIDLDSDRFRAFVLDRGMRTIYEVDTTSGNTSVLATSLDSNALVLAKDLSFDKSAQTIYWSSWFDNSLHRLSLNSFEYELISGSGKGGGESFGRPASIALDTSTATAYVADALDSRIFAVDLGTGERRLLLNSDLLSKPESLAYDSGRNLLNILDSGSGALYALNPETSDLALISM